MYIRWARDFAMKLYSQWNKYWMYLGFMRECKTPVTKPRGDLARTPTTRHEIVRSFLVWTRPALLCWYNVDLVAGSDYPLAECTENGSVAVTVSHAAPHRDTPPSHSQLSSSQVKTTFQSSTWKLLFKQHTWVHTCESGVGLGILCRRTLLLIVAVFGPCSHHWVGFAGLDCL